MITEEKVNNIVIKPLVKYVPVPIENIKGGDILPITDGVSYYCGARGEGKTVVFCNVALRTTNKDTHIWYFSPTAETDETALKFKEILQKRGNTVNMFTSLRDNDGTDYLLNIYKECHQFEVDQKNAEEEEEEEDEWEEILVPAVTGKCIGGIVEVKEEEVIRKKKRKKRKPKKNKITKPKKVAPKHLFIIDDLSTFLHMNGLDVLIKNGRHIHAAIYISFQYKNDLPPDLWNNCNYIFLFSDMSEDKLYEIYKTTKIKGICFQKLFQLFNYALESSKSKKPSFMIDKARGLFKRDINTNLYIENPEVDEFKKKRVFN
jgi:F0F1-type ATP synthase delta subunit